MIAKEPAQAVMDPELVDALTARVVAAAKGALDEHLVAIILKGSAITGDFFPYYSDIDLHVYAAPAVMRTPQTLDLDRAFRFQANIATLDPAAHQVSQAQIIFLSATDQPSGWTPPTPGSYRTVYGELPAHLSEVDEHQLTAAALRDLQNLDRWVNTLIERMVDKPDRHLSGGVRLTGTILKPSLRQAAIVLGAPPLDVWSWPLSRVLALVEPEILPAREASAYFADARRWLEVRDDGAALRAMALQGLRALDALNGFARSRAETPTTEASA